MKILFGVLLIVVLGAGVYLLNSKSSTTPSEQNIQNQTTNQQTNTNPTSVNSQPEASNIANVTITANGFEPKTITIKTGTKVIWINNSGTTITVSSDPHPTHTLYPPLNLGRFEDGQTVPLIFDKPGSYGYHNHLNPDQTGQVVVE
ncbi:MAG: hypothetical protein A2857_00630 [Candidatus Levybacteria bacterium RIFCSPHIGHO2_01_FULL_36_15]|nr:MAG: hypothetical protein A2857_00630 [Candidatus Levybacteria bacterium RIFCSPHIGHO2_01_FULL_36_15]